MEEGYLIPSGDGMAEFTEKRSRFLSYLWHTPSEDQAIKHIEAIRAKHHDAKHNVFAYLIRESGVIRYSDDGEPQGTAGMPVLEVLRRAKLTDVCCVVTRYFGGVLLGAGGLTRAYARAARDVVEQTGISMMQPFHELAVSCPYPLFERVKRDLAAVDGIVLDAQYGADIDLRMLLPQEKTAAFSALIVEQSGGQLQPQVTGVQFRGVPVGKIGD